MQAQAAELARPKSTRQALLIDQPIDEADAAQLAQERRVEVDFVHAPDNLAQPRGYLAAPARIDLHDQHVLGGARAQERHERWIGAVAAVPVRHAVDLDSLE